ncbi:MAG: S8 family serine peptidase, partial [Bacteroidetes bacterium]|nr:S8 family serine peptidase [Bacteroidota bacterium]
MKRVYVFVILLMCIITCRNLSSVFSQTVNYWHQDGKIYFKLKDNVALDYSCGDWGSMKLSDVEFLTPIINKYGLSSIKKSFYAADDRKLQRTYLLAFDEIGMVDELISELQELDIIEYAEPAPIFRPSLSVNDTYYNQTVTAMWVFSANTSWHLNVINAEQAWDISTGDTNIMVAVLDNAIWTDHPDLANKIAVEIDLGDSDSTASPPEATYIWSHGTHSAGLIGAETNNGLGVASIGYNVSLMAVKLGQDASDGQGMTAGFEGIVWAADNGADVISMSWGSPQYFQTMQNTINYAYNKGCVMLAAAGNNGNGMETQVNPDIPVNYVGYPAALEHVIAVGSSDAGDNKSDFSNYGTWIDVLSPGGFGNSMLFSVLSTTYSDAGDLTAALNGEGGGAASYGISGKYDVMQGTSMATPVAAGLAGLMLSVNPDLTPDELAAIMMASCDNVDAQNAAFVDSIGAGRINAAAALQAVLDSMTVITADFMANTVSILPGDAVNFTDLSTGNPTSWTWTFEGGTPAASTLQNPASIQYNDEGTFAVTLEVSDGTNSDIEIKTCFILVGGFLMPNSAWELQNSAFATQYRAILDLSIPNDSVAWGLSYDGTSGTITTDFTRTVNGGQTWTPGIITAANGLAPGNICAINDNVAWVAMYSTSGGGGIYKTSDAGVSWTHQASASFSDAGSFANLVHFFNSNEGFCMGDPVNGEFEIYTTSDGGDTWSLAPGANIPDPESGEMGWTGVYDAVGDTAWFGSNTGRVFRSTDKGSTWEVFSTGRANVSEISMNDALNGVALCAEYDQTTGQLLSWALIFTTDGGQTWQLVSEDLNNTKSDVAAVPGVPGMVVATKISQVTEENGSFYSYNYGGTWVQLDDSVQYTSVDFLSETVGWAGSFNLTESFGGIYKWIGVPMTVPYFVSA